MDDPAVHDPAVHDPTPPLSALTSALYTHADLAGMTRVLTTSLAGMLPVDLVSVERRRTMADRLAGRPGEPVSVSVLLGERLLALHARPRGVAEASVSHVVRGVRLSTTVIELGEWITMLAQELDRRAEADARARDALERFLLD